MRQTDKSTHLSHRTLVVGDDFLSIKPDIESLPRTFALKGKTLYHKRNIVKKVKMGPYTVVVKSFKRPNWINKISYGWLRSSKAARSYRYSIKLANVGIGVPRPIAYMQFKQGAIFTDSYFISEFSDCKNTYNELFTQTKTDKEEILTAIGQLVAQMHANRIFHRDLSGGNILFDKIDGKIKLQLLDLNRMSFKRISLKTGCKNFERLDASAEDLVIMAIAYAKARNMDPQKCINKILIYNHQYHK